MHMYMSLDSSRACACVLGMALGKLEAQASPDPASEINEGFATASVGIGPARHRYSHRKAKHGILQTQVATRSA